MSKRELPRPKLRILAALTLAAAIGGAAARTFAQSECLVKVKSAGGEVADQGTVCAEAQSKVCVFQLQLCLNEADAGCAATLMKKKVKAKGNCRSVGKLRVKPDGSNAVCGAMVGIKVKTRKKGRREGTCNIRISARGKGRHAPHDVDKLKLVCKPTPGECPVTSVTPTTSTTLPSCMAPCPCCVLPITDLARCIAR
jgi:hypothetical protein